MNSLFVLILIIVSIAMAGAIPTIIMYYKYTRKFQNQLVARIHNPDNTVDHYRYDEIPANEEITVKEMVKGEESSFVYKIRQKAIEKGAWGKYIDYDYHVMEPIDPHERNNSPLVEDLKELFKFLGGLMDTDLYLKLMRSQKFEEWMKMMMGILMIINVIALLGVGYLTITSFSAPKNNQCKLLLSDTETWNTIYMASHTPPPQINYTQQKGNVAPTR